MASHQRSYNATVELLVGELSGPTVMRHAFGYPTEGYFDESQRRGQQITRPIYVA